MNFARWVFRIAGVYGLLVVPAMYFMETKIGEDYPPPITHPEYYYGFVGVVLVWQVAYLAISLDPVRYRPFMLLAALAKTTFGVTAVVLHARAPLPGPTVVGALIDLILAVLFFVAYLRTAGATVLTEGKP